MELSRPSSHTSAQQALDPAIKEIAACFSPGSILSAEPFQSDEFSLVFLVRSKAEGLEKKWCLKRHTQTTSEQLSLRQSIMTGLKKRGCLLIPQLIESSDGRFHVEGLGAHWSACTYIEADPAFAWSKPGWKKEHCLSAGAALARFHAAGRSLLTTVPHKKALLLAEADRTRLLLPVWLETSLEHARETLSEQGLARDPLLNSVVQSAPRLMENLKDVLGEIARLRQGDGHCLPVNDKQISIGSTGTSQCLLTTVVHGDFHPGNVLFFGADVKAILDFDHLQAGSPMYDLGYAAVMFCSLPGPHAQGNWLAGFAPESAARADCLDQSLLAALLSGYKQGLFTENSEEQANRETEFKQILAGPALNLYIQLSCHLLIYWLLQKYPHSDARQKVFVRDILARSLALLSSTNCAK